MNKHDDDKIVSLLQGVRKRAPGDLCDRVMNALPPETDRIDDRRAAVFGQIKRYWMPIAAAAGILLALYIHTPTDSQEALFAEADSSMFRIYAPEAEVVELVGTFNQWQRGEILLERHESGYWTASLSLEEGRYEYQFVIDGQPRVEPGQAFAVREDGFGGLNAVVEI